MHSFGTQAAILVTLLVAMILEVESGEAEKFLIAVEEYWDQMRTNSSSGQPRSGKQAIDLTDPDRDIQDRLKELIDASMGGKCDQAMYRDWSPTFKSRDERDFPAYKTNSENMLKNYLNNVSNPALAQDICFSKSTIMECSKEEKCICPTSGFNWEKFNLVEVDNVCYFGKHSDCINPADPALATAAAAAAALYKIPTSAFNLRCVNGTVCKDIHKDGQFICSHATQGFGYNNILILAALGAVIMWQGKM